MAFSSEYSSTHPQKQFRWQILQALSITFNQHFPQALLTPPAAMLSQNGVHHKMPHEASCSSQVNPFSTATNINPPFAIITPIYGHESPAPLCWGGPLHRTPPTTAAENVNLIKPLDDAIMSRRNDPLPERTLSQYSGDPLQWHQDYGQCKSAIDYQPLTVDVKLTYLKTLVKGKATTAEVDLAYCGAM